MPFQTTAAQHVQAAAIATRMAARGLPIEFVDQALRLASDDQGAFELMELWAEARTKKDRDTGTLRSRTSRKPSTRRSKCPGASSRNPR
jgi:hypothetical protein